jgi:molybdopterin synthase catalytic subunit
MSSVVREASVVDAPLSVDRLLGLVQGPRVGGIAIFVGAVRDHDLGSEVVSLDYSQHPSATEVLARCATRTAEDHDVLAIAVSHRTGHLRVGDLAVVVAVGAVHRGEALAACSHLINTLKVEVPIWKEQQFVSGATEWVGLPSEPLAGDGSGHTPAGDSQTADSRVSRPVPPGER